MKKTSLLRVLPFLAVALAPALALAQKPLQIWVYNQNEAQYYQKMVDLYNQKTNAGLKAEFQAYGYEEMPDKFALAVKSGINAPDVVQFDEIFFSLYLRGEVPFLDLTGRMAKGPLKSGLLQQRLDVFTWKGRVYGIPQSTSSVLLWYREDLFKAAGITPNDIRTWEGFEAAARKVKGDGRNMLALDWSYLPILVRQRGYNLFGKGGEPFKDSAVIVDTWNRIVRWNSEGIGFMPGQGGIFSPRFFGTSVTANDVLAIIGPDWYGLDLLQNFAEERKGKWRAMPLPVWTDSVSRGRRNTAAFSGQGLVILKKSPRAEAAWKFVEWVMSDADANVERYLQGNCFTPYQPAWADLRLARPEPFFGGQVLTQTLMDVAPKLPPGAQSPANALIINFLREQYFSATMNGGGDSPKPADAIVSIKDELRKMGYMK
jgi:arabinosaccharide transport system substrate-binding protein